MVWKEGEKVDAITINTAKKGKDARQDAKLTHMSDKAVKQAKEKISTAIQTIQNPADG